MMKFIAAAFADSFRSIPLGASRDRNPHPIPLPKGERADRQRGTSIVRSITVFQIEETNT